VSHEKEFQEGAHIKPPWEKLFLWRLSILGNMLFACEEALKTLE